MSNILSLHRQRFDTVDPWDQEQPLLKRKPAPGKVTLTSRLRPTMGRRTQQPGETAGTGAVLQRKTASVRQAASQPSADDDRNSDGTMSSLAGGLNDEFSGLFEKGAGQSEHEPVSTPPSNEPTTLPDATRGRMERSFGQSFADVQVHPDSPQASGSKHAITTGRDMHFAPGRFQPGTSQGDWLIGHELAHVVQQTGGPARAQAFDGQAAERGPFETEADRAADAAVAGRPAHVQLRTPFGMPQAFDEGEDPYPDDNFRPANSFTALINLVRVAETRLNEQGQDTKDVIHTLRGIFYGTEWSMDFLQEGSHMRNHAFQIYTATLEPDDPRPVIGLNLFSALRGSPEVKDPTHRSTDFGHLIIGLDARGFPSDYVSIPTQGGTGLDITTWLGDIGGGAGMLAMKRGLFGRPQHRAIRHFRGSDYGGSINIEGDVAGVVGVQITSDQTLASALENYLLSETGSGSRWNQRAKLMLEALGGEFTDEDLTNQQELIDEISEKVQSFGVWYAVLRLQDQGNTLTAEKCRQVGRYLVSAAKEMATIFVNTLVWSMSHPESPIDATLAGQELAPIPPGDEVPYQIEALARGLEEIQNLDE